MLRRARRPLTVLLALGLAAATAGCTTFSDNDAVARVEDVELTRDEFETELTASGVTPDQVVSAVAVRSFITSWIQEQLAALPVDPETVAARHDGGLATGGSLCLAALVVEDEATATEVAASVTDAATFDEQFVAENIDQQLAASGSALSCLSAIELENVADIPFVAAAMELDADNQVTTAPLVDEAGNEVAWVVLRFRPFAELSDAEVAAISTGAVDADIHVDPRIGTFDPTTGQVVPLG